MRKNIMQHAEFYYDPQPLAKKSWWPTWNIITIVLLLALGVLGIIDYLLEEESFMSPIFIVAITLGLTNLLRGILYKGIPLRQFVAIYQNTLYHRQNFMGRLKTYQLDDLQQVRAKASPFVLVHADGSEDKVDIAWMPDFDARNQLRAKLINRSAAVVQRAD